MNVGVFGCTNCDNGGGGDCTPVTIVRQPEPVTLACDDCPAPLFVTEPQDVTVEAGQPFGFSTSHSGDTAQWERNTGSGWNPINGGLTSISGTSTLQQDGDQYRVTITNSCGTAVSTIGTLTVTEPCDAADFTGQPQSVTVNECDQVTLAATVDTVDLPVTWRLRCSNGNTSTIVANGSSNAGTFSHSFTAALDDNGNTYTFEATNDCGTTFSQSATVTVNPPSCSLTCPPTTAAFGGATYQIGMSCNTQMSLWRLAVQLNGGNKFYPESDQTNSAAAVFTQSTAGASTGNTLTYTIEATTACGRRFDSATCIVTVV